MPMPVKVSLISAVYNKAADLPATLASIRAQENLPEVEIIFADDASTDGSVPWLKAQAAADPRIKVIENTENAGPAVRINQAAEAATGEFLLPFDADDILPANAVSYLLRVAEAAHAPLVMGGSKRTENPRPIEETTVITAVADPLAFTAQKQIVHMGFLASRSLWHAAGGADESIFIQDQSLPLRLAARAGHMQFVNDVIYWLTIPDGKNLSANVMQQHHDRFFACLHVLENTDDKDARTALARQIISACWKARRDSAALPWASGAFLAYLANRAAGWQPSAKWLSGQAAFFKAQPNIRRPEEPRA